LYGRKNVGITIGPQHEERSPPTINIIHVLKFRCLNYDGRKCDKCSGKIAASETKSISPKLCASCKVIGSGGGGGRSIA
jgi:hypothetical protein